MQSYLILLLPAWIALESGLISNTLPNKLANMRHKLHNKYLQTTTSVHRL